MDCMITLASFHLLVAFKHTNDLGHLYLVSHVRVVTDTKNRSHAVRHGSGPDISPVVPSIVVGQL